jgi:hypothetical protein
LVHYFFPDIAKAIVEGWILLNKVTTADRIFKTLKYILKQYTVYNENSVEKNCIKIISIKGNSVKIVYSLSTFFYKLTLPGALTVLEYYLNLDVENMTSLK